MREEERREERGEEQERGARSEERGGRREKRGERREERGERRAGQSWVRDPVLAEDLCGLVDRHTLANLLVIRMGVDLVSAGSTGRK